MRIRERAAWVLAALCVLLAWPHAASAQGRCVGSNIEGLGGTGLRGDVQGPTDPEPSARGSSEPEGLGGTGQLDPPEVFGIDGTISGFASICVNGIEVAYDGATPIAIDGRPAAEDGLAIGQVVRIDARVRAGSYRAVRISARSAVAGPIAERALAGGELRVLGQRVVLSPDSIVSDRARNQRLALRDLEVGSYVSVSGLRRADGTIVASRVERDVAQQARVSGAVSAVEPGALRIGALRVETTAPGISVGDEVTATGALRGGALVAAALEVEPELPFDGKVAGVALEGFVQADRGRRGFRLRNAEVDLGALDLGAEFAGMEADRRVRVLGRLEPDGRVVAERLEVRDARAGMNDWRPFGRPRADLPERMERSERMERGERSERPERMERPERPERTERPERPERSGRQ